MAQGTETESRKLLGRLRETLAEEGDGQERLDRITHLIADSMRTEVCSIYLFRDNDTLELCATEGLNAEAVHQTRMRLGEGLVGRVRVPGEVHVDPRDRVRGDEVDGDAGDDEDDGPDHEQRVGHP